MPPCQRPVAWVHLDTEGKITQFACQASWFRMSEPDEKDRSRKIRCVGCNTILAYEIGDVYPGNQCEACIAKPPAAPLPKVSAHDALNTLLDMVYAKAKQCAVAECPNLATRIYTEAKNTLRCEEHLIDDAEGTAIAQSEELTRWWPYVLKRAASE